MGQRKGKEEKRGEVREFGEGKRERFMEKEKKGYE